MEDECLMSDVQTHRTQCTGGEGLAEMYSAAQARTVFQARQ